MTKESTTQEPTTEESASTETNTEATEQEQTTAEAADATRVPPKIERRASSGVSILSLVLATAALGLSGWLFWQFHLTERQGDKLPPTGMQALASQVSKAQGHLDATTTKVSELESRVASISKEQDEVASGLLQFGAKQQALEQRQAAFDGLEDSLSQRLTALERQQQGMAAALMEIKSSDQDAWRIDELAQLVRLAEQRLFLARDQQTALRLLSSADRLARDIDDAALHGLRAALAHDLAALHAVPRIDRQGLFVRLVALEGRVDQLPIRVPRLESSAVINDSAQKGGWRKWVDRVWEQMRGLVVVRRDQQTPEALLSRDQEFYLRQNLRFLLKQAQSAVLEANTDVYQVVMKTLEEWLLRWFDSDATSVAAFVAEVRVLTAEKVAATLPDLSATIQELRAYQTVRKAADLTAPTP